MFHISTIFTVSQYSVLRLSPVGVVFISYLRLLYADLILLFQQQ